MESPCLKCNRVKDPKNCENKNCNPWRNWFLKSWNSIHGFYKTYKKEDTHELEAGSH